MPAGAFWALLEEDDQDSAFSCKEGKIAAFLQPQFDRQAALAAAEESGVEGAEAGPWLGVSKSELGLDHYTYYIILFLVYLEET